jgi:signal peptidase II
MITAKHFYLTIAFSLIIGGAFGNVIDRLHNGGVTDFIDFHIAGYHWPAFNLADSVIFIGVAILLCHEVFLKKK